MGVTHPHHFVGVKSVVWVMKFAHSVFHNNITIWKKYAYLFICKYNFIQTKLQYTTTNNRQRRRQTDKETIPKFVAVDSMLRTIKKSNNPTIKHQAHAQMSPVDSVKTFENDRHIVIDRNLPGISKSFSFSLFLIFAHGH